MKHIVVMDELDYKEVISALRRARNAADALEVSFLTGELYAQIERIEKVFGVEEQT